MNSYVVDSPNPSLTGNYRDSSELNEAPSSGIIVSFRPFIDTGDSVPCRRFRDVLNARVFVAKLHCNLLVVIVTFDHLSY
jgi:hypothetical protein